MFYQPDSSYADLRPQYTPETPLRCAEESATVWNRLQAVALRLTPLLHDQVKEEQRLYRLFEASKTQPGVAWSSLTSAQARPEGTTEYTGPSGASPARAQRVGRVPLPPPAPLRLALRTDGQAFWHHSYTERRQMTWARRAAERRKAWWDLHGAEVLRKRWLAKPFVERQAPWYRAYCAALASDEWTLAQRRRAIKRPDLAARRFRDAWFWEHNVSHKPEPVARDDIPRGVVRPSAPKQVKVRQPRRETGALWPEGHVRVAPSPRPPRNATLLAMLRAVIERLTQYRLGFVCELASLTESSCWVSRHNKMGPKARFIWLYSPCIINSKLRSAVEEVVDKVINTSSPPTSVPAMNLAQGEMDTGESEAVVIEQKTATIVEQAPVVDQASSAKIGRKFLKFSTSTQGSFEPLTDRFLHLDNKVWYAKDKRHTSLGSWDLPLALYNRNRNNPVFAPFLIHSYMTADMVVKVKINAPKFSIGTVQLSFYYAAQMDAKSALRDHVCSRSTMLHALADTNVSNEIELRIPFKAPVPWIPIKNRADIYPALYIGRLDLKVLNQLIIDSTGVDGVGIFVYGALENIEYSGLVPSNLKVDAQMLPMAVKMAESYLSQYFSDKNRDKPPVQQAITHVIPQSSQSFCLGTNLSEPLNSLRLDAAGQTPYPFEGEDEMSIDYVKSVPGLAKFCDWPETTDEYGKLICKFPAAPCWPRKDYETTKIDSKTCYYMPPVAVLSQMYGRWRGSLVVTIKFYTSQFTTGSFSISYVPLATKETVLDINQGSAGYHAIIDIKGGSGSVDYVIPYIADKPWWPRLESNYDIKDVNIAPGMVFLHVINPLNTQDAVLKNVYFNIYIRGGPDFEVSVPIFPTISLGYDTADPSPTPEAGDLIPRTGFDVFYVGKYRLDEPYAVARWGQDRGNLFEWDGIIKKCYYKFRDPKVGQVCKYQDADNNWHVATELYWVGGWYDDSHGMAYLWPCTSIERARSVWWMQGTDGTWQERKVPNYKNRLRLGTTSSNTYTLKGELPYMSASYFDFPSKNSISEYEIVGEIDPPVGATVVADTISSPTDSVSVISFGESFVDGKTMCRRYVPYKTMTVAVPEKSAANYMYSIPVLPVGLSLSPEITSEKWTRDSWTAIFLSAYRFYRGSMNMRFLVNSDYVGVYVTHKPDRKLSSTQISKIRNDTPADQYFMSGYATHYQDTSINKQFTVNVPFYQPGQLGLLQKPKIYGSQVDQYYSLGDIHLGFNVNTKETVIVQMYSSLGDDFKASGFIGYPPVFFRDEIIKSNVAQGEMPTNSDVGHIFSLKPSHQREDYIPHNEEDPNDCYCERCMARGFHRRMIERGDFSRTYEQVLQEFRLLRNQVYEQEPAQEEVSETESDDVSWAGDTLEYFAQGEMPKSKPRQAIESFLKEDVAKVLPPAAPVKKEEAKPKKAEGQGWFNWGKKNKESFVEQQGKKIGASFFDGLWDQLTDKFKKSCTFTFTDFRYIVSLIISAAISGTTRTWITNLVIILFNIGIVKWESIFEFSAGLFKWASDLFERKPKDAESADKPNTDKPSTSAQAEMDWTTGAGAAGLVGVLVVGIAGALNYKLGKKKGETASEVALRVINGTTTQATKMRSVVDLIKLVFEWCSRIYMWFARKISPAYAAKYYIDRNAVAFQVYIEECQNLLDPQNKDSILVSPVMKARVQACYALGNHQIQDHFKQAMTGDTVKNFMPLMQMQTKLHALYTEIINRGEVGTTRYEPFVVCFNGTTSIGKSQLATEICKILCDSIDLEYTGEAMYTRNATNKHWNGVRAQPVLYIDDFGQVKPVDPMDSDYAALMYLKSSAIFIPEQAHLDDKNRSYAPKFVILNTNVAYPKATNMADPMALYRRRDVLVDVRINPECIPAETRKLKDTFMFTDLPQDAASRKRWALNEHLQFKLKDPLQDVPLNDPKMPHEWNSWEDFKEYLKCKSVEYNKTEMGNYLDRVKRNEIKMPKSLGDKTVQEQVEYIVDKQIKQWTKYSMSALFSKTDETPSTAKQGWITRVVNKLKKWKGKFKDTTTDVSGIDLIKETELVKNIFEEDESENKSAPETMNEAEGEMPIPKEGQIKFGDGTWVKQMYAAHAYATKCAHTSVPLPECTCVFEDESGEYKLYHEDSEELIPLTRCSEKCCFDDIDFAHRFRQEYKDSVCVSSCNIIFASMNERPIFAWVTTQEDLDAASASEQQWTVIVKKTPSSSQTWAGKVWDGIKSMFSFKFFFRAYTVFATIMYALVLLYLVIFLAAVVYELYCLGKGRPSPWAGSSLLQDGKTIEQAPADIIEEKAALAMAIPTQLSSGQIHSSGDQTRKMRKAHPTGIKRKAILREAVGELAPDQSAEDLIRLTRQNIRWIAYVGRHKNSNEVVSAQARMFALGDRYMLLPYHYIHVWQNIIDLSMRYVDYTKVADMIVEPVGFKELEVIRIEESELCIVRMPARIQQATSMVKWFAPEGYFDAMTSQQTAIVVDHSTPRDCALIPLTSKLTSATTIMNDDVPISVIPHAIQYGYHGPGKCMTPILDLKRKLIVGFHVAGAKSTGIGYADPVVRETFEDLLLVSPPPPTVEAEVLGEIAPCVILEGNLIPVGTVKQEYAHDETGKTRIRPSLIQGVFPVRTEPNPLSPADPRTGGLSPMRLGCEKHGKPPAGFAAVDLRKVEDALFSRVVQVVQPPFADGIHPRSLQMALEGVPNCRYLKAMELKTAEGFGYKHLRPRGAPANKEWLVKRTVHPDGRMSFDLHPELVQVLDRKAESRRQGITPLTVFTDCLKDTRLVKEKCIAGKTRIFSISPTDFTIQYRQIKMDWLIGYTQARYEMCHAIGISDKEWTELYRHLTARGYTKVLCGDYSNFGPAFDAEVHAMVNRVENRWMEFNGATRDHVLQSRVIDAELENSYHLCFNVLYKVVCGMPSGSPTTAQKNSQVNLAYLLLAWLELSDPYPGFRGLSQFFRNVIAVTYGDDLIATVSDEASEFYNNETLHQYFARFEIKYTDAAKTGEMRPWCSIWEATFLKRSFVPHVWRVGYVTAGLDKVSIEDTANWIWDSADPAEATRENAYMCALAAYGWGPEYFNYIRSTLLQSWAKFRRDNPDVKITLEIEDYDYFDRRTFEDVTNTNVDNRIFAS